MTKTKKYISLIFLFFLTYRALSQAPRLDLTQPEQQKDFLQYLKSTVSLLEDKSIKEMTKGVEVKKISDSAKQQLGYEMMRDTTYFKRLYAYFDFLKVLEGKYHISKFSKEEWEEVARFGASHGIYFLSTMKKRNEKIDSLPRFPNYFPPIPLLKAKDSLPSSSSNQN
jgi:hypothetical protein